MDLYLKFIFIYLNILWEVVYAIDCSNKVSSVLNGKEYKIFRRMKTYDGAKRYCQLWGQKRGSKISGLASVLDPGTQTCLTEMITTRPYSRIWNHLSPFARGYYIGGNDRNKEGVWKWDNDDEIPFQNKNRFQKWGTFEPNDHNNEDCLLMLFRKIDSILFRKYTAGTWVDVSCKYRRFYICEREISIVKPKKLTLSVPSFLKSLPTVPPSEHTQMEVDRLEWGYRRSFNNAPLTPENWKRGFPTCGGPRQSPVHINFKDIKKCNIGGPSRIATWGSKLKKIKWVIKNTGKAIEIRVQPPGSLYTKFKDSDDKLYIDYMRLVWGETKMSGSEHRIGSHHLDGELQIFHHPLKKGGERHALAFLLLERKFISNDNWNELLRHICRVQLPNLEVTMETSPSYISRLLEDSSAENRHKGAQYITEVGVRYRGSITHPPCTADVIWTVYPRPISLAYHQFFGLRRVIGQDGKTLGGNTRPIQRPSGPMCKVE